MPRKLLRRYLPDASRVHSHWLLRRLGARLHHPRLWHLNRRSVSGATAVGLFVAFLPLPFQMILAALGAVWLRVNLPLAVAWIFVTNPVTMGPAFYLCYKLGAWMLKSPPLSIGEGKPSVEWLLSQFQLIWQPLATGSLVVGTATGVLGYCLVQIAWRAWIIYKRGPLLRYHSTR
ncbi:MAG: DUF2062 domain-containing protein [Thiogranum sp.]|nr:DUF2062 domain-containing protein [Thiogranum sp.]